MAIRLVVGLGNPGDRYAQTRHNVGFMLVDRLAQKLGAGWARWRSALGEYAEASRESRKLILARPLTYMNESGRLVGDLARYSNIVPADVLVCYDDFALPLGRLRLRLKGSAGGHNGMQSIIDHLGTPEVPRLRVGIGPLPQGAASPDFVLSRFKPADRAALDAALDVAAEAVLDAADRGVEPAMNRYNPEPAA